MANENTDARLEELERRLAELERRMAGMGGVTPTAAPLPVVEMSRREDGAKWLGEWQQPVAVVRPGVSGAAGGVAKAEAAEMVPVADVPMAELASGTPVGQAPVVEVRVAAKAVEVERSVKPPVVGVAKVEVVEAKGVRTEFEERVAAMARRAEQIRGAVPPPVPAAVGVGPAEASGRDPHMPPALPKGRVLERVLHREREKEPVAYAAVKKGPEAGGFERMVGLKLAAWLGALVLVIGAGLGIKFAYDNGWFGGLSPAVRLVLFSLGAFGLIGAGEWALRRVGRLASVGLFGAGVACLFVVAWAGHHYYDLYTSGTALGLMAAAMVIGALVSARANLVSIAVIALLGGHLAPVVLGGDAGLGRLVAYLVGLQVVALVLAGRVSGERWWVLRWLSLGAAVVWVMGMSVMSNGMVPGEAMVYALVTAGLGQVELVVRALREKAGGGRTASHLHTPVYHVLLTGFAVWVASVYLQRPDGVGLAVGVAGAGLMGVAAWLLNRGKRGVLAGVLVRELETGYRGQGLLVLVWGVYEGLTGNVCAWVMVGVGMGAAVWAGVRKEDGRGRVHFSGWFGPGLVVGVVGYYLRRLSAESLGHADEWATVGFGSQVWRVNALWGLLAVVCAYVATWLAARPQVGEEKPSSHPAFAFLASGMLLVLAYLAATPAIGVGILLGVAWVWAGLTLLSGRRVLTLRPAWHARGLLGAGGVVWLMFVALGPRMAEGYAAGSERLLLNMTAVSAVFLAVSVFGITKLLGRSVPFAEREERGSLLSMWSVVGGMVVLFIAGLLEIDRGVAQAAGELPMGLRPDALRGVLMSVWLSIASVVWLVVGPRTVGSRLRGEVMRMSTGLGMFAVVAALFAHGATVSVGWDGKGVTPIANVAFAGALLTVVAGLTYAYRLRVIKSRSTAVMGLLSVGLLAATGVGELFRYGRQSGELFGTNPDLGVHWLITLWLLAVAMGTWAVARKVARTFGGYNAYPTAAMWMIMVVAVKGAIVDQIGPWMGGMGAGNWPVVNMQVATAVAVLGALYAAVRMRKGEAGVSPRSEALGGFGMLVGAVIVFVSSSSEVARGLRLAGLKMGVGNTDLLVLAGYSVWWSIMGLAAVAAGFAIRNAAVRWAGLGLFALTLVKVLVMDLANAGQGWRILSLLCVGGILIVTSVLYAKLAPILLRDEGGKEGA